MKATRRTLVLVAVLASALYVGVTAAGAGEVRWFGGCYHADSSGNVFGGTATTAAGPLTVSFGWATSSSGLTQKFLAVQYVTYSVNGGTPVTTPVGDLTGWGPITQGTDGTGKSIYGSRWTSPVLATLQSGQSATITVSLKTTKKVWDDAKTSYNANTELLGAYTTCAITAS
jgi:hypothetical protein